MNHRREFLKKTLLTLGAVIALPSLKVFAQEKKRGGGDSKELPLVEPGKGMAAGVSYVHKTSDIKDAKLKGDRQGVAFEKQTCAGCQLYVKHGMKGSDEVGKCSLFPNQVVKGSGWCTSWTKKM